MDKYEGLAECLPAEYPKTGGLIIVRDKKGSPSKSKRSRKDKVKAQPWYRRS